MNHFFVPGRFLPGLVGALFLGWGACSDQARGQSLSGMSGLFQIPTAEILEDKTVVFGFNRLPREFTGYGRGEYDSLAGFATVAFLPRLELMFRYTYQLGRDDRGPDTSVFMDRMVGARFLMIRENEKRPALLAGLHDPGELAGLAVNNVFGSNYVAATKYVRVGVIRSGLHLGAAFDLFGHRSRVHRGIFGGVSVAHHSLEGVQLIGEYDSIHWNTAVRVLVLERLQILAGLRGLEMFSGGVSYRFGL